MKYLLSLLILFSGLSFSSIYLICDEPYTLYPDKEKRELIQIEDSSVAQTYIYESRVTLTDQYKFVLWTRNSDDLVINRVNYKWSKTENYSAGGYTEEYYEFYLGTYKGNYNFVLNRTTLRLYKNYSRLIESKQPKCEVASNFEFLNAKKELEKIADDLTNKSKKEHQKELDKRKI